jgi:hypothetical protein
MGYTFSTQLCYMTTILGNVSPMLGQLKPWDPHFGHFGQPLGPKNCT